MTTERDSAKSTGDVDDVLTEIKYLGEAAESDLHSLGIRRFDDLIQYTPEELAKRLYEQTNNPRYSVEFITNKDWIGQAKTKVDERNRVKTTRNRLEDWDRHAEFNLYFEKRISEQEEKAWQTRVRLLYVHGRERDTEITFDGITPKAWVKWILRQADLPGDVGLELIEQRTAAPPAPVTPSPAQVSILGVEAELKSLPDVRNKTVVTSIRFTVSGAESEALTAERTPYQILILIVDQEHHLPKLVASKHGLSQPEQSEYACQLEFPLPDLGRYELQTIVLVQSQIELMAIHHGPRITIVP